MLKIKLNITPLAEPIANNKKARLTSFKSPSERTIFIKSRETLQRYCDIYGISPISFQLLNQANLEDPKVNMVVGSISVHVIGRMPNFTVFSLNDGFKRRIAIFRRLLE